MKKTTILTTLLLAFLLAMPVIAEEEEAGGEAPKKEKFLEFDVDGFYRLRWTRMSSMQLYPEANVPRARYWEQKLRLEPELTIRPNIFILKRISFFSLADIYDGQTGINNIRPANLQYDLRTWNHPHLAEQNDWKADGFWLREYWAEIDATVAVIRVGRMASNWGTGILSNAGKRDTNDFGDSNFGDTVERVMVATRPIDVITGGRVKTDFMVAVAYDWLVVEDRTGDEDDNPTQYIIAFQKMPEKETGEGIFHDLTAGAYYVHREQDDNTVANLVDMTARIPYFLRGGDIKLSLTLEGVYIWGSTDANQSLTAPEGSDVRQFGAMGRLAAETKRLDLIAEVGYASGDPDPFDDKISDFHFNRDYNVGLLMFERALPAASANSSYMFTSPALLAQAPAGIDLLPSNGSVTNAVYVNPRVKLRPVQGFEVVLGVLKAWAPTEIMDPYRSFLNGGTAFNYNGRESSRDLGWELDLGVSYTYGDKDKLAARVGAQWGWFWPGEAWDRPDGHPAGSEIDKIDMGQFRFDILF